MKLNYIYPVWRQTIKLGHGKSHYDYIEDLGPVAMDRLSVLN